MADEKNCHGGGWCGRGGYASWIKGLPMSNEILDYAESLSERSLDVARKSYDELHERVYKLATVLAGGAGAMGAYALGKYSDLAAAVQWLPLAVLSLWWFATAGILVLRGAISRTLSPGNGPDNIRKYYAARLAEQPPEAPSRTTDALRITREAELDLNQKRLRAYSEGCNARSGAVDTAYRMVAVSPVAPLLVIALMGFFGLG
jgi:hypothetical protein